MKEVVEFLRTSLISYFWVHLPARGIACGVVGRMKHIQFRALSFKDLLKQEKLKVHPAGTKETTADLRTKPLSGKRIRLLMRWMGFYSQGAEVAENEKHNYSEANK